MKFHAAMLMLAGWYLMTPPLLANGRHDKSAPLGNWRIEAGSPSGQECEQTLAALKSRASREGNPADIEAARDARCFSTDDPRLKEN